MDFLFPLECLACTRPGTYCCRSCLANVPLSTKSDSTKGLTLAAAYAYAEPIVRRLIHDLKYEHWTAATEPLSRLARRWAFKAGESAFGGKAVLVPVPLSRRRFRVRGFNQASVIARATARPPRTTAAPPLAPVTVTRTAPAPPCAPGVRFPCRGCSPRSRRGRPAGT